MPTSPVKTRIPLTSFGHLITEVKVWTDIRLCQLSSVHAYTPQPLLKPATVSSMFGGQKNSSSYTTVCCYSCYSCTMVNNGVTVILSLATWGQQKQALDTRHGCLQQWDQDTNVYPLSNKGQQSITFNKKQDSLVGRIPCKGLDMFVYLYQY